MARPHLDYAQPRPGRSRRTAGGNATLFGGVALAVLALSTCARIEVLNARAGGYLPAADRGKWRESSFTSEQRWRQWQAGRRDDPSLLARPLSAVEDAEMRRFVREARARNALRDVVGSAGVAQYAIAPLAVFASLLAADDRRLPATRRTAALACAVAAAAACGLMFYRGYFASLGW